MKTQWPVTQTPVYQSARVNQPLFAAKAKNDAFEEALEDAKDMVGEKDYSAGVIQAMMRGHMPLKLFSSLRIGLNPEQAKRFKAYDALVRMALRPVQTTPEVEAQVAQLLDKPSPELQKWINDLKLDVNALKTPVLDANKINADALTPNTVLTRMRDLGLFRLKVPTEYGGLGLYQKEYDAVIRTMSRVMGALTVAVSAHSTIGSAPIMLYGTEAQKKKYLHSVSAGEGLAAFGLTEPGAGTDVAGMKTTARLSDDGKDWVINGDKTFITNTQRASLLMLVAKTDLGKHNHGLNLKSKPTVFSIELPFRLTDSKEEMNAKRAELEKQGLFISEPLQLQSIRGSHQAKLVFKDFKLPVEHVLGGVGKLAELPWDEIVKDTKDPKAPVVLEDLMLKYAAKKGTPEAKRDDFVRDLVGGIGLGLRVPFNALNKGRAGFGPIYTEQAKLFLQWATDYANHREMFDMFKQPGDKRGKQKDLPQIQDYLAEMARRVYASNAVSDLTTALIDKYGDKMNIICEAAAIKVLATEENFTTSILAKRIFGGSGLTIDHPNRIERETRDVWLGVLGEGANEALKYHLTGTGLAPIGEDVKNLQGFKKIPATLKRILGHRVAFQKGDYKLADAVWLQRKAGKLNTKISLLGARHGEKLALRQRDFMKIADVLLDLYSLSAVMLKLKHHDDKKIQLPADEKMALEDFVEIAKKRVNETLGKLQFNNADDARNAELASTLVKTYGQNKSFAEELSAFATASSEPTKPAS